jgi:hypothetical protein
VSNELAPGVCTWDLSPPRRCGTDDFNGAAIVFRAEAPYDPRIVPTANDFNTRPRILSGFAQVLANAKVSVSLPGGSPALSAVRTIAGVSPGAAPPTLNVERTPGGAANGDIFVWWAPGSFPTPTVAPRARVNGNAAVCICGDWYTDAGSGHSGIRVVAQANGGDATDVPFTVDVP